MPLSLLSFLGGYVALKYLYVLSVLSASVVSYGNGERDRGDFRRLGSCSLNYIAVCLSGNIMPQRNIK